MPAMTRSTFGVTVVAVLSCVTAQWSVSAGTQEPAAGSAAASLRPCRVRGLVRSGDVNVPGATVTAREGDVVRAVTSTDADGVYALPLAPGTYSIKVELSAFAAADQIVTLGDPPCERSFDIALTLASRVPGASLPPPAPAALAPAGFIAGAPASASGAVGGRGGGRGGGARGGGAPRFQALVVEAAPGANEAVTDVVSDNAVVVAADDPAARLLPPGFASGAAGDAVTVSGSLVQVDRGMINERADALTRGEFGLAEGQQFGAALQGGLADQGTGGIAGGGRGGGPGGAGGVALGGRGGSSRLQVNTTYGVGGSMFDAAPYSLRGEPATERDYLQQNFSTTIGGALKIPRIYDGTNRTTFNFSYSAARNGNMFDQYATVPSEAYRSGDFAASSVAIIDPLTGAPFADNRIPESRISPAALALLRYVPTPNLPGSTRNFHISDTTLSTTNTFSFRITHTLTQPQTGRGGRGGGAGGAGGAGGRGAGAPAAGAGGGAQAAGGRGGGRGAFQPPLNVTLNATVNYRNNDGDRSNVFPLLAGATTGSSLSVPVTVNIRAGRNMHALNVSASRTRSSTLNRFAYTQDVAGLAGITGVATDPFDWGVPSLTFGTFTALRDVAPSRRVDRAWQASYSWTRPAGTHNWRAGGSYSTQFNKTQSDSNARGTFTFTGLYTAGDLSTTRGSGQDFADFLLGLPQQATRQYSITSGNISTPIAIQGRQFSLYAQDDWRWKARWTINYGVQYDFTAPYTETGGHMVNLDASPDFTAVSPIMPGEVGPYSGVYGAGLVSADWNNVAPKVGVAWRASNREIVRFGYGLSFNSGSYSTIARNLYQQPPFFRTATSVGTLDDPLSLTDAFSDITESTITNNYGIDKNYQLGRIHQWTVDYNRTLLTTWNAGVTYIGTRGANLDMLRAPNRGPDGPRIDDVQSFSWQSAEGESYMNGLSLRLQKRQARGLSGSVSYTWSKARDNTTATGGNATVAQDDQNLDAEWGLSNFDRRHQFTGSASYELPWGRNRQWLSQGGVLAAIAGDWSMSANLNWQSGAPLTARCSSCAANVAQGVVGTLRANYNGAAIGLDDPTIDQYFNTAAFAIPDTGTFGSSYRNMIIGPGSHLVNAQFTRDVTLGGSRSVSINVNVNNLLNTANYGSIDTNVNSPTFGQVLSVTGRRTARLNFRVRF